MPHERIVNERDANRRKLGRVRVCALAAIIAFAALTAATPVAVGQNLSEGQLRARFVLNFLRFTEWPPRTFASSNTAIEFCVLGIGDPFNGGLTDIEGATAGGRRVNVHAGVAAEDAGTCQLLYVPDSELRRVVSARESIGKRPVLIVGESEAVLERGGMVALRAADRHLAFVVNLGAARRAELDFSPQMLHAAAEVLP
jgi:hypothetical protein